jgi:hypothetical protein
MTRVGSQRHSKKEREREKHERKKTVDVKFEVHTVVHTIVPNQVFWGATPCRLVMYIITDVSEKLTVAMFR